MKRNVSGSGGTCPISEEPPAIEIHCIYRQEKTGCEVSEAGSPLALDNGQFTTGREFKYRGG